jgi:two-component sensor histidine kinase
MNGSTENAYSLDRYESVKVQSILSEMITRKTLEYSRRADFSITLKEDFSLSSNIFLKTVPEELKRAISNIVDNSFDAVDGKGEIEFKVECGNGLIEIRISDNGRGIPEDQIPHIFTMGKSFKAHGNGFGLSQAKEIVSSLGGEIDISSKVGVGTTVRITLLQDGEDSVLESVSTENFDFILIDDSKIRRLNSKKRADLKGKKLAIFKDVTEFLSSSFLPSINRTTPIYLDSDLGEHQPGEILAKTLFYEVGFKNIILYTAGNLEELRSKPMPWLSAIIGKDEVQNLPV